MDTLKVDNFFSSFFGFEKNKGKLKLFLLLLVHIMGWCFIFLLPLLFYPVKFEGKDFFLRELLSKTALVGLFYLNYYYLLPAFFEKKKFFTYFLSVLLFIVLIVAFNLLLQHSFPKPMHGLSQSPFRPFSEDKFPVDSIDFGPFKGFGFPPFENTIWGIPERIFFITANRVASFALILLLLGALIRLSTSYVKNQHEKKELENANLNAEINLLKSQINPHFLFNTLNSIYALAQERSEKTEAAILKLSEMLRYMLYESADEKAELNKEIDYITNYIQLQRIRLSDKIKIEYRVEGKTEGLYIAPFLLITFIENAFKHGVSYAKPGSINIHINVFEKTLTLFVENIPADTDSFTSKGLGLKNAERRLDLLYHNKYSLHSEKTEDKYIVNLKILLGD